MRAPRRAGSFSAKARAKRSRAKSASLLVEAEREQRELLAQESKETQNVGRVTTIVVVAGGALTAIALVTAATMILRDLAARRRAEEALAQEHNLLSSIINAMPNSVYVKDVKGRYILDNTAHRALSRDGRRPCHRGQDGL